MGLFERKPRNGDTVIAIQADGCMATDWRVLWIGTIETQGDAGTRYHPVPVVMCRVTSKPGHRAGGRESALVGRLTRVGKNTWQEIQ